MGDGNGNEYRNEHRRRMEHLEHPGDRFDIARTDDLHAHVDSERRCRPMLVRRPTLSHTSTRRWSNKSEGDELGLKQLPHIITAHQPLRRLCELSRYVLKGPGTVGALSNTV